MKDAMIAFFSLFPQSLHKKWRLILFIREKRMINYIMLYRMRKKVKKILKDKISEGELATTKTSCLGCVADDISWEIYYLLKEKKNEKY